MLRAFLSLILILIAPAGFAAIESSTTLAPTDVISFRSHSVRHTFPLVHNMHMLWANGLAAGSTSVYLYASDDPFLYATTLKAVTSREKMLVIYDTDPATRGPWGDASSSMLTSITILK
ncbi:hypothetical protein ACFQNF_13195 [Iodobacter arcticus]|uniref:Uncharacterized protein n=1 Tax=Iodobacter arcticus TaxID=590593 RepID=A0ABW2R0G7_9NEIS